MSGIVGIINQNQKPVDEALLKKMTASLTFRGPDDQGTWIGSPAGFGHTLLRTTEESNLEKQPCSLDGNTWIVADARVDGRRTLLDQLDLNIKRGIDQFTDAELILYAHQKWGKHCIDHLIGDFSFAIWDREKQDLFCARDHFGVKPFYFVQTPESIIFSNTLNCLRIHHGVSDRLNDHAIFSFLVHGFNPDLNSTTFSDIHRLPPAHTLFYNRKIGIEIRKYWSLSLQKTIYYKADEDYVDHFQELFKKSVSDRLRTHRIGVFMSGGLDSTSVTLTAKGLLETKYNQFDLRACTCVYERLIPDDEKYFSSLVAKALEIPIFHIRTDDDRLYDNSMGIDHTSPEPTSEPMITRSMKKIRQLARPFRVGLSGQGGDPLLHPTPSSFLSYFNRLESWRILFDIVHFRCVHGQFPKIGFRTHLRQKLRRRKKSRESIIPPWLNREFKKQMDGFDPEDILVHNRFKSRHPRSEAHRYINSPVWVNLFECSDPGVTQFPAEIRHPFFDLRLVFFLLSLPPVPWCIDKMILRKAMRGRLPVPVLQRPKSPLQGFPEFELIQPDPMQVLNQFESTPMIKKFIDTNRFLNMAQKPEQLRPEEYELITRPIGLAIWLDQYA